MLRHMTHATVIVADITTQVAISDQQEESWLMAATMGTMLISALALARDCSASLFSPPTETTFEAG